MDPEELKKQILEILRKGEKNRTDELRVETLRQEIKQILMDVDRALDAEKRTRLDAKVIWLTPRQDTTTPVTVPDSTETKSSAFLHVATFALIFVVAFLAVVTFGPFEKGALLVPMTGLGCGTVTAWLLSRIRAKHERFSNTMRSIGLVAVKAYWVYIPLIGFAKFFSLSFR